MGWVRFGEGGVGQARASDHRAVVCFAEGPGSEPSDIGSRDVGYSTARSKGRVTIVENCGYL